MINRILQTLGKEKLYVVLKPEKLRKIVERGKEIYGTYKELYQRLGICESTLFKMKRNELRAISSNTILDLAHLTNVKIKENDIISLRSRPSGYSLSAELLFIKDPFLILNDWDNYLLGAIASDGSLDDYHLYLRIIPHDVEFSAIQIYALANLAEKIHDEPVNVTVGTSKHKGFGENWTMNSVIISSILLILFLEKILKLELGTNYSMPSWLDSNKKFIFPWIAGLTDGDGSILIDENNKRLDYWEISNGSIEPLKRVKKLLTSNIGYFDAQARKEKHRYVLRVSKQEFYQKLFPCILPFVVIERKRKRIVQALDYLKTKGFDVNIPEKQRTTRNPIMDKVVEFLRERDLLTKLQNWEKLETYEEQL